MGLVNKTPAFENPDDPSVGASSTPLPSSPTQKKASNMSNDKSTGTKVVTGVIRGSYCNLFTARAQEEGKEPKYGMTILIPKTDTVTLNKIKAAQEAAILLKWPNKRPAMIAMTMHDGDGARPSTGEPFGDECKGHMVMACQSKFKPKIIDRESNEVIDPAAASSGDYFKVSINAYGYEVSGKRGVSFGLNNVLFWEKGESLGGMTRAEDDFASDINNG